LAAGARLINRPPDKQQTIPSATDCRRASILKIQKIYNTTIVIKKLIVDKRGIGINYQIKNLKEKSQKYKDCREHIDNFLTFCSFIKDID